MIGWEPHDAQERAYRSSARFRPIAAGRRSGKTTLAAVEIVERAFQSSSGNWRGAWVTPGHSITETGFRKIDEAVADEVVDRAKLSPPREHHFVNGATIDYLTTSGDPNVSEGYDFLVIDEAAKGIPEEAWTQELRPTLSNTLGDAVMISTPDGRGWFFDWWHRGQDPDHPEVESFRWSTYEADHVPDSEVDAAREELPDRIFRQEYLAEFVDDTGGVFSPPTEAYAPEDRDGPAPYRIGVDLARQEDYLAVVVLDSDGMVTHLVRERGLGWPQIQRRIQRAAEQYHGPVAIDATRDNKLVSDLDREGLDIRPVTFSAKKKQQLIENLAGTLERRDITVPESSPLTTELQVFEYETTRSGNIRYGAPDGHHDDLVDALALAADLDAGGSIPTARATFGNDTEDDDGNRVADILPDLGK